MMILILFLFLFVFHCVIQSNETQNETPLDVARKENKEEIDKAIFKACMKGDLELVQRILSFHPNSAGWIDNVLAFFFFFFFFFWLFVLFFFFFWVFLLNLFVFSFVLQDDRTPLHVACLHDKQNIAFYLIDKGANLEAQDEVW